jgi:hypothetical protein
MPSYLVNYLEVNVPRMKDVGGSFCKWIDLLGNEEPYLNDRGVAFNNQEVLGGLSCRVLGERLK